MNNHKLKVFSGRANPALAEKIARHLGDTQGKITLDNFPDGEVSVRIEEDVRGRDVFIVQPTCPPVNENLMELLIMIDSFKRASAERITAVLPYYGYARQDRRDPRGTGPLEAVQHDEQLHQVLVDRRAGRLQQVDVPAAPGRPGPPRGGQLPGRGRLPGLRRPPPRRLHVVNPSCRWTRGRSPVDRGFAQPS